MEQSAKVSNNLCKISSSVVYLKQGLKSFHVISYIQNAKSYLPSVLIFMPNSGDVSLQHGFSNNVAVSFK